MSENSKEIIKNTLDAFLGVRTDEENKSDNNISIAIDEFDTELLSEAIVQALEKAKTNESPNQFKQ